MSKLLVVLLALLAGLTGRGTTSDFPALLDTYYEEYLALFPIEAAINGDDDRRYDAVWPNEISAAHRDKVVALCDKYLAALAAYDRAGLLPGEQLSYDTLQWSLRARRDLVGGIAHLQPVNQFNCPTLTFAQLASGKSVHPFATEQDYRNFISRARGFSVWVDTAIANMREGMDRGIVQPRILMERVQAQLEPLMADDPVRNILFGPLVQLPAGLAPTAQAALEADYLAAIRQIMIPAYRRLHAFIATDYLPRCRDTAGIGELPGGAEAYAAAARWHTSTDLAPAQIHEIGLKEVARIRGEMDEVRKRVAFPGTLADFLAYVASDPRFTPFKNETEVLAGYRAIGERILAQVPKFFAHVPRTKFEVRATEAFRVATASHEYIAGTADGARPGVFYVPVVKPEAYSSLRMENLFLHEAIPGHHFQIALALENTALPRFRRYDACTAYVEGWGLYTERLGRELGLYSDPYQYLGMLVGDMQRAVRLVVDTGIHAQGWSRERALDYAAENEGGKPAAHVAKIERYMAWPGQALAYKIGQLKILELRAAAERQLGTAFDIRGFHSAVLMEGALPLSVLEAHVQAWVDAPARR
jgi:uncharacterized protein (DUF885 family)